MRICSFLPSATEILFALGLGDSVAGVTFECDFPPEALARRVVVRPRIKPSLPPAEVDREVNAFVARGESLYEVDSAGLKSLEPDLIITQDLCHVCAATPDDLGTTLAALPRAPKVLSLSPRTLRDVWRDILSVGEATGRQAQAAALVQEIERGVARVEQAAVSAKRSRVVCLEWLDPPFIAGHWVPEMVALAGGIDAMGKPGEPGFRTTWESVLDAQPETIVVMPCGYHLREAAAEFRSLPRAPGWEGLPAVRQGRVFAVDASSYFSRPGPRLATGLEILAHLLERDGAPGEPPAGGIEPLT
jgi:iron complex transport system substrate-binding protein